jgi:hypothetical protein
MREGDIAYTRGIVIVAVLWAYVCTIASIYVIIYIEVLMDADAVIS